MKNIIFFLVALLLVLSARIEYCNANEDVIADIEKLIELGEKAPHSLIESIVRRIEGKPGDLSKKLSNKVSDPKIGEDALAVYLWALGLTKDDTSIDVIIEIARDKRSGLIWNNALNAMASIGGEKAGKYLLSHLKSVTDKQARFEILNRLGQMQYAPALPESITILELDPKVDYWQSIFVFGKMGDISGPFLVEMMGHENRNVRINSIAVLGKWLIPPEATIPLRNRFWVEDDLDIKQMILAALERTSPSLDAIYEFSREVIEKEKPENNKVITYAKETIDFKDDFIKTLRSFRDSKKVDAIVFEKEYDKLYESFGKRGDFNVLSVSSSANDESKLKKLRERILQRNSDESFYDYQEINMMIIYNRLIKDLN